MNNPMLLKYSPYSDYAIPAMFLLTYFTTLPKGSPPNFASNSKLL